MLSHTNRFHVKNFFWFVRKTLYLDIDVCDSCVPLIVNSQARLTILAMDNGLASVVLHEEMTKYRIAKMISDYVELSDENEAKINLPIHMKDYYKNRLRYWIDNAFLANEMKPGREYIVDGDAIYPVDFKSTGVIETNKKWGDGLQQFLEMIHGLPCSPLSLIKNFLSNIDFFERYGSSIVGVTGTLGNE